MLGVDRDGWLVCAVVSTILLSCVAWQEALPRLALACSPHTVLMIVLACLAARGHQGYLQNRELFVFAGISASALLSRTLREWIHPQRGALTALPHPFFLSAAAVAFCCVPARLPPHNTAAPLALQSCMALKTTSHSIGARPSCCCSSSWLTTMHSGPACSWCTAVPSHDGPLWRCP